MRLITFISVGHQNREIHILLVMIGVLRLKFQPVIVSSNKNMLCSDNPIFRCCLSIGRISEKTARILLALIFVKMRSYISPCDFAIVSKNLFACVTKLRYFLLPILSAFNKF